MSLINDMLQDLDARGAPNAMAKSAQVKPVFFSAQTQRQNLLRWAILAAMAICLVVFVALAAFKGQTPATVPVAMPPVAAVPVKAANAPASVPTVSTAPANVEESVPTEVSQPLLASLKLDAMLSKLPQERSSAPVTAANSSAAAVASVESERAISERATPGPALRVSNELERSKLPENKVVAPKVPASAPSVMQIAAQSDTAQQRAENEYRKANQFLQQGRNSEAVQALEQALVQDPRHHAARQTLATTLINLNRNDDAIRRLQAGLQLDPSQSVFAMMAARLLAERNELTPALDIMYATLPVAANNAEYQALLAALLQRDKRHKQAVEHYLVALQLRPENGVWWMGLAISLQAENRLPQAFEAYHKAKNSNSLNPQLQAFVEQKMLQMQAGDSATRSNK